MRFWLTWILTAAAGSALENSSFHSRSSELLLYRRFTGEPQLFRRVPGKNRKAGGGNGEKGSPKSSIPPQITEHKTKSSPRAGRAGRPDGTADLRATPPPTAQRHRPADSELKDDKRFDIPPAESVVRKKPPRTVSLNPLTGGSRHGGQTSPQTKAASPPGPSAKGYGKQLGVEGKKATVPPPASIPHAYSVINFGSTPDLFHVPPRASGMVAGQLPSLSQTSGSYPLTRSRSYTPSQSQGDGSMHTSGVSPGNSPNQSPRAHLPGQVPPQWYPRGFNQSPSPPRSLGEGGFDTHSVTSGQTTSTGSMSSESSFASSRGARLADGTRPSAWTRGRGRNTRFRSPEDPNDLDWRPGRASRMGDA